MVFTAEMFGRHDAQLGQGLDGLGSPASAVDPEALPVVIDVDADTVGQLQDFSAGEEFATASTEGRVGMLALQQMPAVDALDRAMCAAVRSDTALFM